MAAEGTPDSRRKDSAELRFGRAPGALPLLGHAVELLRRPLAFMESLTAHGDLVEIRLGPRPAFVLAHPDLAHRVLTDFRTFDRTGAVYDRSRAALGSGLATSTYEDHRRQRLIMQPAFRHEHLRGYVEVMRQEIAEAMTRWRDAGQVDLVEEVFTLTNAVSLKALFSSSVGARDAEELREAFDLFLRGIYARAALPLVGRIPSPANRRYARALSRWRSIVARLIEGYRHDVGGRDDLMAKLVAARDDEQQAMSDEELSDQVAVLLLAGGETTSASVLWTLHLLANHPGVLAALRAETGAVLGGEVAGWEHLRRLDLTARAVREAMRLYPPAWILPRTCVREVVLAGHTLPAGSMVVFSPYVLHRRADLYPEPHTFDPDRWLPAEDGGAPHRASYLPFGAGATKCVGEDFGTAEAALIVATIVEFWDLSALAGTPVSPAARAVLVPRSLPVRLTPRR
ncbi:cytochrome P450 [Streptomyces sp. NBC_01190]|uniref:cytochrome P450 n=1 Tax=Streptomyces sp. NBC_01190 TaxID=2903767 RepID=UPI003865D772|nr:cytochrome P450 [Streptomyces sp. NBC_01190]